MKVPIITNRGIYLPCLGSLLVVAASALPVIGAPSRGGWWWTSPAHPWGRGQVIGNPTKETEVLRCRYCLGDRDHL
jgi:hypothetical protein